MSEESDRLLLQPWDPFNKAQHEAHMNAWLMLQTMQANARAIDTYMRGYTDWHTNALRDYDMGLPIPPPPAPPVLQNIEPKPPGYWFQ